MPLRARLREMPSVPADGLWPKQQIAITRLQESFARGKPKALIQMATGSGKTFTAANIAYRLIKFGHARRICFLVDRSNLGRQTLKEFQQFQPPDERHTFDKLYNTSFPQRNNFDPVDRVVITTIQRLYSVLTGQPELAEDDEDQSLFENEGPGAFKNPPKPIALRSERTMRFIDGACRTNKVLTSRAHTNDAEIRFGVERSWQEWMQESRAEAQGLCSRSPVVE